MSRTTEREAFRFHLQHGGYCTPPGRAQCALNAARTEQTARDLNLRVVWEYEDDFPPDFDDERDNEKIRSGEWEWLRAHVPDPMGIDPYAIAACGGIAISPDGQSYRRVMEADLLAEAVAVLRARLEGV